MKCLSLLLVILKMLINLYLYKNYPSIFKENSVLLMETD